ncbi:hypothetical protein H0H87_004435 [Tephrocybe sp. NHM501043]|nr:hypothetical protein H0H87_004435 [Tephrocybe sp. NHM501043]
MASRDKADGYMTDDIPPDSQLTNPNGKVVLGHLGPTGGLNLDLDHPLAENFKLRVGQVEITVPSVTPRDDYIIVLFGDSGNASPAFAITRITSGESTTTKPNSTTTASHKATSSHASSSSASIVFTDPIPITGTTITGGVSSSTGSSSTATTVASALTTASTTPASSTSSSPANTASAANAATTSNSAMPQSKAYTTLASFGVASLLITLLV